MTDLTAHLNHISGPNGVCYTIGHSRLKNGENDHHWKLFENLPATHAFVLDRVQISNEQTCKAHLTNLDPQNANLHPAIFKVLCATIVDDWPEEIKPYILDEKLQVRWIHRKVASYNTSRLEAHAGFFRLLMKGIFDLLKKS